MKDKQTPSTKATPAPQGPDVAGAPAATADHEAAIAVLRADLAAAETKVVALTDDNAGLLRAVEGLRAQIDRMDADARGLQELLESATKPSGEHDPNVAPPGATVRVRSANPKLRGFCLHGRPLDAVGFDLDISGWTQRQFDDLNADPMVVVERLG